MAQVNIRLRVRFPWWARWYIRLAVVAARLGVDVDPQRVVDFIVHHTKVRIE